MISKTVFILADGDVPYRNQAVEEYLLRTVEPETCILYLWQNRQTVVIGRNQNGRAECRVGLLEEDGGYLARRLSGGGAVFHDLGNLNFSFIAMDPDYSVQNQLRVILKALSEFGLKAEISGRNDITVDGRKISGNAYISSGKRHCHHGTLLINADTSNMSKYLSVAQDKLESKGVRSVRSRVLNLAEIQSAVTPESMTKALYKAFGENYGVEPEIWNVADLDKTAIEELTEKFASAQWRLENEPDFRFRKNKRFSWGGIEICLQVSAGKVTGVKVFTDALSVELPELVKNALIGANFSAEALCKALSELSCPDEFSGAIDDILSLLMEAE